MGYQVETLDPELETQLVGMNDRLGLTFGAYDLIISPNDEPVRALPRARRRSTEPRQVGDCIPPRLSGLTHARPRRREPARLA